MLCSKTPLSIRNLLLLIYLTSAVITQSVYAAVWDANFTQVCETERHRQISINESLRNDKTFVCGQTYDRNTPPAQEITISLDQCLAQSPGWEKSRIDKASQWAGPLLGFLLPALGFIIVIPREWTIEISALRASLHRGNTWRQWFRLVPMFGALAVDTLLGIVVVFGWAGPFIVGAIHEVLVDHIILEEVQKWTQEHKTGPVREQEWFAVAIVLVGSFSPDKLLSRPRSRSLTTQPLPEKPPQTFATLIQSELSDPQTASTFLTRILIQFLPFSGLVGVPLVFYVGSFIYSLVDADARLGENDTAHSVAFGLWYFVIVIVATISSTVLGVTIPTNIESALAHRRLTPTDYQHKWLSSRRLTLARWADQPSLTNPTTRVLTDPHYHSPFHRHSLPLYASLLSITALAVPCGLATAVSYNTPQIGLSCRSASALAYLLSQSVLILLWFFHSSPSMHNRRHNPHPSRSEKALTWTISTAYIANGILSLFFAVAGTMMQLLGVYRSCICKAGLWYALPTTSASARAGVRVLLSTDTAGAREAADLWIKCGEAGIVWMAIICIAGAAHRVLIKARCLDLVENFGGR